jgi:hypothetical protein
MTIYNYPTIRKDQTLNCGKRFSTVTLCLSFAPVRTILSVPEAVQKLTEEEQNAQAVTKKENVEGKTKMTHSKNKIISKYFPRLNDVLVLTK